MLEKDEIFSKVLRAGRRTYFFDVRSTKADDYYITITESKKFTEEDGSFHFKKHKIYLYKEDFAAFKEIREEMTTFVLENKGEEVISERHQKDFKKEFASDEEPASENATKSTTKAAFWGGFFVAHLLYRTNIKLKAQARNAPKSAACFYRPCTAARICLTKT